MKSVRGIVDGVDPDAMSARVGGHVGVDGTIAGGHEDKRVAGHVG